MIAELSHVQWSIMGKKTLIFLHPRNFGSNKIICTQYVRTSTPSCKPDLNFAFQVPELFGGKSLSHPDF